LNDHCLEKHRGLPPEECPLCLKWVGMGTMREHVVNNHSERPLRCMRDGCDAESNKYAFFVKHNFECHGIRGCTPEGLVPLESAKKEEPLRLISPAKATIATDKSNGLIPKEEDEYGDMTFFAGNDLTAASPFSSTPPVAQCVTVGPNGEAASWRGDEDAMMIPQEVQQQRQEHDIVAPVAVHAQPAAYDHDHLPSYYTNSYWM